MDELISPDSTFSVESFLSKVNNIYVMLCTSMMTNNLKRVDHFIGDNLYNRLQSELEELNDNNLIHMYDELNVKNSYIDKVEILDDKYIIDVVLTSRYLSYYIDKTTKDYVKGDREYRLEKANYLRFTKKRITKNLGIVQKCPTCGASMDLNNTGICPFCKKVFSQEDYDWILEEMR